MLCKKFLPRVSMPDQIFPYLSVSLLLSLSLNQSKLVQPLFTAKDDFKFDTAKDAYSCEKIMFTFQPINVARISVNGAFLVQTPSVVSLAISRKEDFTSHTHAIAVDGRLKCHSDSDNLASLEWSGEVDAAVAVVDVSSTVVAVDSQ